MGARSFFIDATLHRRLGSRLRDGAPLPSAPHFAPRCENSRGLQVGQGLPKGRHGKALHHLDHLHCAHGERGRGRRPRHRHNRGPLLPEKADVSPAGTARQGSQEAPGAATGSHSRRRSKWHLAPGRRRSCYLLTQSIVPQSRHPSRNLRQFDSRNKAASSCCRPNFFAQIVFWPLPFAANCTRVPRTCQARTCQAQCPLFRGKKKKKPQTNFTYPLTF